MSGDWLAKSINYMKKFLLLSLTMFFSLFAHADGINIFGVYYNLISANGSAVAEVTKSPEGYSGSIVIPELITYNGIDYTVTAIGNSAFMHCQNITSVTLPSTIKSIGKYSFQECWQLNYLNLPEGLTSIGERAFWFSGLISVELPSTVTYIAKEAFLQCTKLLVVRSKIENPTDIYEHTFMNSASGGTYDNPTDPTYVKTLYVPKGTKDLYQSKTGWKNFVTIKETDPKNIAFADDRLRQYCVKAGLDEQGIPKRYMLDADFDKIVTKWDANGDEELSYDEAAAITDIGTIFGAQLGWYNSDMYGQNGNKPIWDDNIRFDEFKYFKGVTTIPYSAFYYGPTIYPTIIPEGVTKIEDYAFSDIITEVYCYAKQVPNTSADVFANLGIENVALHVPEESIGLYSEATPWNLFKNIVALEGESHGGSKCTAPTINYSQGKLTFSCDTEGVEFVTEITDTDVNKHYSATIQLSATYNISVYATKEGYENSETVTATLCWIDAEPKTEGITNDIAQVRAIPVLIKSNGGILTIEGVNDGETIEVFTLNGTKRCSAVSKNGVANICTNIKPGGVAIVRIGEKSVKVIVK